MKFKIPGWLSMIGLMSFFVLIEIFSCPVNADLTEVTQDNWESLLNTGEWMVEL